ncbi:hypothetical protein [Alteribacillus sp. HJP-4]|uniref:hypothetical protein n=1 Tax=Alteribacillus sp. HJP-4 TaxID=2775394 RepID=UPI0035CCFDC4
MEKTGFISNSLIGTDSGRERTLMLKKGQIFEGKVIKLFPNHIAALRLGTMNVNARLEAALTAGERYFFQVLKNDGIPRLQVLNSGNITFQKNGGGDTDARHLLTSLGLRDTKAASSVLKLFQDQELPFTKRMLADGAPLLKQAGMIHQQGASALVLMNEKELPLTMQTLRAVTAVQSNEPFSKQVSALLAQAQASSENKAGSNAVQQLRSQLAHVLQQFQLTGFTTSTGGDRIEQLLAFSAGNSIPAKVQEGAVSLLQRTGLLSEGFRSEGWLNGFKEAVFSTENKEMVHQLWPNLMRGDSLKFRSLTPEALFQKLVPGLQLGNSPDVLNQLQLLSRLFQQAGGQKEAPVFFQSQSALDIVMRFSSSQNLDLSEKQALTVLLQGSFSNPRTEALSSVTAAKLGSILTSLGVGDEALLQKSFTDNSSSTLEQTNSLKQSLQQLLPQLPFSLREGAEAIITRITGQQLLSQDQHGQLQQLAVQIPLVLGEHHTDLTVQWEGKKQSDGSLDPEHCRILFYLELEKIGETIADVQIHNRFVTVNIFNDLEKPSLFIELLQPFLKERLEDQNYQLQSLHWKAATERQPSNRQAYQSYSSSQGVDVRI